jgi:O-antigen/teichoic acid export membrane protein
MPTPSPGPPADAPGPGGDEAAAPSADPGVEAARHGMSGRLARGTGVAGIGFLLNRGLTFATYLVLAQLIVPSDAGKLAAGQVLVGMGFVFAESGMLAALIHWKGDIDTAASTATASSIATGVLLALLALATAPLVGTFFHSSTIGWVAAASSGLLLLRALAIVPDALLQRRFAFVRRVTVDPLGALANGVVAISACAAGLGVWGLLLGQYGLFLTQAVAGWGLLRWKPRRRLMSFAIWRELASYARHVVASEVVRRSTAQLDSILLGRIAGSGPLGQYAYGLRIATVPTEAWVSVANYALLPAFARIADEPARFRRAFLEALGALCTVGLPISLSLLVLGDRLALALFGPEWPQSGEAISALCGLGIGQMLISISSETYKAAGRPQLLTRTHLLTAVLSLILLPALLVLFDNDVVGIAVAVSVVAVASGLYALRLSTGIVGASAAGVLRGLCGLIVATALALGAAYALGAFVLADDPGRAGAALQAVAMAAVLAVVYAAAARVLAPQHFARVAGAAAKLRRRR